MSAAHRLGIRCAVLGALAVALITPACGDADDADTADDGRPPSTAVSHAVPDAPAACAGEGRQPPDGEGRLASWTYTKDQLDRDPTIPVWLGFSRILSPEEIGRTFGGLEVHGIHLVYEQRQGTYAKVIQNVGPVAADSPEVGRAARDMLDYATSQPNILGVGGADAFEPVDDRVRDGNPPFAGLLVTGDLPAAIAEHECLIYSLAVDGHGTAAQIPPAIEPDILLPDRG